MNIDVLVVDNENVELFVEWLQQSLKLNVIGVRSGILALKFLESNTATLTMIDLAMAEMDGITLLRAIRAREFHGAKEPSEIWIITGQALDTRLLAIASDFGVHKLLQKPFDFPAIEDEIRSLILTK